MCVCFVAFANPSLICSIRAGELMDAGAAAVAVGQSKAQDSEVEECSIKMEVLG